MDESVPTPNRDAFYGRWQTLPGEASGAADEDHDAPTPQQPEYDLLWFLAQHGDELEPWERDVFLAVREESFYFYPVFACQIMNEGWASYWHARLLREAEFLPQDMYVQAIKAHSDVVRPHAAGKTLALSVNPYHLGFSMWERIVDKRGLEKAREICAEEDDFGFVRNYLDAELAAELDLFVYEASADGEIKVASRDHPCDPRSDPRAEIQLRLAAGRGDERRGRRQPDARARSSKRRARSRPAAGGARARLRDPALAASGHAAHRRRSRKQAGADEAAAVG